MNMDYKTVFCLLGITAMVCFTYDRRAPIEMAAVNVPVKVAEINAHRDVNTALINGAFHHPKEHSPVKTMVWGPSGISMTYDAGWTLSQSATATQGVTSTFLR